MGCGEETPVAMLHDGDIFHGVVKNCEDVVRVVV